jgi:chromosome segregation ATPase
LNLNQSELTELVRKREELTGRVLELETELQTARSGPLEAKDETEGEDGNKEASLRVERDALQAQVQRLIGTVDALNGEMANISERADQSMAQINEVRTLIDELKLENFF